MPKTTTIKGSGVKDKPVTRHYYYNRHYYYYYYYYYYCCCCYYYEKVGCRKESYFLEFLNVDVARGFGYCVNNENVLESDWFLTAHIL